MTRNRDHLLFLRFFLGTLAFSIIYIYLLGNPRVSYDGWQYLSSAKAIMTSTLPENYFWVRQPGYPLFIAVSSLLSNSLWFLFGAQVLSFILAYTFFVYECKKYFTDLSKREFLLLASINFIFIFIFIGGYFIIVTPQAITGAFLLLLTAGILRVWRIFNSVESPERFSGKIFDSLFLYIFFPLMTVSGYCLSTFIGLLPILSLFLLLTLATYSNFKNPDCTTAQLFRGNFKWVSTIILSTLAFLSIFMLWQILFTHALNDIHFNKANLQDPFWGDGISSYLNNLRADPALLQYIPASFLALIMFIPNQGWNGVAVERSMNSHSQNGDIGFGLFSTNYGQCVLSPPEVLTVNNKFISNFLWQDTCAFTGFDLPLFAYLVVFPPWIAFCGVWIWSLFKRKHIVTYIVSIPVLIFLGVYSIFGGGIDRYGSSAYPIITFLSILTIYDFFQRTRLKSI